MNKATKGFVYATSCLAVLGALTLGQPRHVEAATGLQLTSSYVKSAQSLQTAQGKNNIESSSWRQNMLQVTHQNWQGNHYEMSEQDQQRVVDPANLTSSQSAELNQYAMGLLNQVRGQLGRPQLETTSGSRKFAQQVARNYVADNRDIHDHQGHDVAGI